MYADNVYDLLGTEKVAKFDSEKSTVKAKFFHHLQNQHQDGETIKIAYQLPIIFDNPIIADNLMIKLSRWYAAFNCAFS